MTNIYFMFTSVSQPLVGRLFYSTSNLMTAVDHVNFVVARNGFPTRTIEECTMVDVLKQASVGHTYL